MMEDGKCYGIKRERTEWGKLKVLGKKGGEGWSIK